MRKLAALAAAAALAGAIPAVATAQSSVTIYGTVDVTLDYGKAGNRHQFREISSGMQGSRLGFRGTEDLGGGLSAMFDLQGGINVDSGTFAQGGLPFGRLAVVGLSSRDWGTVQLGRSPTPYYYGSLSLDAFAIGQSGILSLQRSDTAVLSYALPMLAQARTDNSIVYITPPTLGGFHGRLQYAMRESSTALGNFVGGSVGYTKAPIDLVASVVKQKSAGTGTGAAEVLMVGGNYDFGVAKAFLGYIREHNSCTTCTGVLARVPGVAGTNATDFRMGILGVRVPMGATTWVAQVMKLDDRSGYTVNPGNRDALAIGVGLQYAMSKRTNLYGSVGTVGNKNGSNWVLSTGSTPRSANFVPPGNPRAYNIGLGIAHSF